MIVGSQIGGLLIVGTQAEGKSAAELARQTGSIGSVAVIAERQNVQPYRSSDAWRIVQQTDRVAQSQPCLQQKLST